jgi:hypothetical protein
MTLQPLPLCRFAHVFSIRMAPLMGFLPTFRGGGGFGGVVMFTRRKVQYDYLVTVWYC